MLVCFLLSEFEHRSLHVAASSCGRGFSRKRSLRGRGRGHFLIRIKKAFSNISGYVWTRHKMNKSQVSQKCPVFEKQMLPEET